MLYGTHPQDRFVKYVSDALSVLGDLHTVGILVWFCCNWCNIGVFLSDFSAWNISSGTTALVSNSFSDTFHRICFIQVQTICFCECQEIFHDEPWLFPGSNYPCYPPALFTLQVPSKAQQFISATPSQVRSIRLTPFKKHPVWTQCLGIYNSHC